MKLTRKKTKPKFWEWILFDKKAFKILFHMSFGMGVLVSLLLVSLPWIFEWNLEVSVILTALGALNLFNAVRMYGKIKYVNSSVNDFVYSGKLNKRRKK